MSKLLFRQLFSILLINLVLCIETNLIIHSDDNGPTATVSQSTVSQTSTDSQTTTISQTSTESETTKNYEPTTESNEADCDQKYRKAIQNCPKDNLELVTGKRSCTILCEYVRCIEREGSVPGRFWLNFNI